MRKVFLIGDWLTSNIGAYLHRQAPPEGIKWECSLCAARYAGVYARFEYKVGLVSHEFAVSPRASNYSPKTCQRLIGTDDRTRRMAPSSDHRGRTNPPGNDESSESEDDQQASTVAREIGNTS